MMKQDGEWLADMIEIEKRAKEVAEKKQRDNEAKKEKDENARALAASNFETMYKLRIYQEITSVEKLIATAKLNGNRNAVYFDKRAPSCSKHALDDKQHLFEQRGISVRKIHFVDDGACEIGGSVYSSLKEIDVWILEWDMTI